MKILVLCLPGLGDTLMFTPALKLLRERRPDAHITVLVMYKSSYDLMKDNPHVDTVVLWEFMKEGGVNSVKFMLRFRKQHFDISILAFPANRLQYNMVSFLAGAKLRLGHRYKHQNLVHLPVLNHKTVLESDDLHNVQENLRLLQFLGIETEDFKPALQIFLSEGDRSKADRFWEEHDLSSFPLVIGMHVWSTTLKDMHRKCWDKDRFAQLIDRLHEAHECQILLFEGPHDREVNGYILDKVAKQPVVVRDTTVTESAAFLGKCSLLVTNDSGMMHVGAAMKVPNVAIFGPTNHRWVGPFSDRAVLVKKALPCQPCFIYSTNHLQCRAGLDFQCLSSITVDEVMAATETALADFPSADRHDGASS